MKAIQAQPENAIYNFNLGALYFNMAADLNAQMNAITGTSAAENKKYDELKSDRDKMFSKALPFMEKTNEILGPKAETLTGEDRSTYRSSLIALKELYARKNQTDKVTEIKKKLDTYK